MRVRMKMTMKMWRLQDYKVVRKVSMGMEVK